MKRTVEYCSFHGKYESREIDFGNIVVKSGCPGCIADKKNREAEEAAKENEKKEKERIRLWTSRSGLPEKYLGEEFVEKENQKISGFKYYPKENLILIGGIGSGKTFFLTWIGETAIRQGYTCRYMLGMDLDRRVKDSWRDNRITSQEIIDDLIDTDILIIDEIGKTKPTSELYAVIDGRYRKNKGCIYAGNATPTQIKSILGEDIVSRITANYKILNFGTTDYRINK